MNPASASNGGARPAQSDQLFNERLAWCQAYLPKFRLRNDGESGEACCEMPGHEDSRPSLFVGFRAQIGRFSCQGCGQSGTLVDYAVATGKAAFPVTKANEAGTAWVYRAPGGDPVLRVTRGLKDGKKTFWQSRWDGAAWSKGGLGPGPAPLLFAPELAAAKTGQTVFFVEGEKCAQRLAEAGLLATTAPEGAGKFGKVGREYLDLLLPLGVVILPDQDKPGFDHALKVARRLRSELALEAKILLLPGLAEKQDVFDWLESRPARDLLDLVPTALTLEQFEDLSESKQLTSIDLLEDPGPPPGPPLAYRKLESAMNETTGGTWTEPEPFARKTGDPSAPLWAVPESFRHLIDTVAGAKQITPGTVLSSMIGVLSSICGGRYIAELAPQYESHAHVWVLLSLRSAGGKSVAADILSRAVFKAQKRLQEAVKRQNDANAPERARILKQICAMEAGAQEDYPGQLAEAREMLARVEKQPEPRFLWKDVSPQKLDVLYAKYQRVSLVSPESADWLALIMGYGSSDQGPVFGSMLSGHTVEPNGSDRITREESFAQRPVLTLFLACQQDEVRRVVSDPIARRRGFLGRTLVFREDSLVGGRLPFDKRPRISASDLLCWEALVDTVTNQVPPADEDGWIPLPIPVSAQAQELYCRLFDVVEKRLSPDSPDIRLDEYEDIAARTIEQVGRLAVLVHVLWTASRRVLPTSEPISEETVLRAFGLALWALQGFIDMSATSGQGESHDVALALWQDLNKSPLTAKGFCTLKEWIRVGPNRWRSSAKLDGGLVALESLGYIQVTTRRNVRGPASRVIELNPLARHTDPKIVATVATVCENPLFIDIITAKPHLRRFATVATVSSRNGKVKSLPVELSDVACDGISPSGKVFCDTVASEEEVFVP